MYKIRLKASSYSFICLSNPFIVWSLCLFCFFSFQSHHSWRSFFLREKGLILLRLIWRLFSWLNFRADYLVMFYRFWLDCMCYFAQWIVLLLLNFWWVSFLGWEINNWVCFLLWVLCQTKLYLYWWCILEFFILIFSIKKIIGNYCLCYWKFLVAVRIFLGHSIRIYSHQEIFQ